MQKDAARVVKKQMFNNSKWTLHQDSLEMTGHDLNVKNNSRFKRRILLEKNNEVLASWMVDKLQFKVSIINDNPIETGFNSLVKGKLGTDELLPVLQLASNSARKIDSCGASCWKKLRISTRRESVKRQNALSE
jgi:hypothetical protein